MINKLQEIYQVYGMFYIRRWAVLALTVISLFTLNFEYFLIALGFYFLIIPVLQTIIHEYICHEYISPKNKVIDFVFLLAFYMYDGGSIVHKRNFHVTHHRYWKVPEKDPTQEKMIGVSVWKHVLGFERPTKHNLDHVEHAMLENNSNVKLLDPYAKYIHWSYIGIMFLILPWAWFVALLIYVPFLLATAGNFHDVLFHGSIQSKDKSWYLPFYGNGSWHITHHSDYSHNYHGPGIMPKLNPAWYFQKIFFVENKKPIM